MPVKLVIVISLSVPPLAYALSCNVRKRGWRSGLRLFEDVADHANSHGDSSGDQHSGGGHDSGGGDFSGGGHH